MSSIHRAKTALAVTAHTKQLPTGEYLAYIEHHTGGSAADGTESFIAGVFDNDAAALAAAMRLMQTFQSSVVAHRGAKPTFL